MQQLNIMAKRRYGEDVLIALLRVEASVFC